MELPELLKGSIPSSIAVDVSSTGSNIVRDRTNCIHERLWRCGFLHADISARSSERREKAWHSIDQQTRENPCHACLDWHSSPHLTVRRYFPDREPFSPLPDDWFPALRRCLGLHLLGRVGRLHSRQLSILISTFFDTQVASSARQQWIQQVARAPRKRGFGKRVAISRFSTKATCSGFPSSIRGHSAG